MQDLAYMKSVVQGLLTVYSPVILHEEHKDIKSTVTPGWFFQADYSRKSQGLV